MEGVIECSQYVTPQGMIIPVKFKYQLEWKVNQMAVSTFDPNNFLTQEIKGANETKYTPFPKGEFSVYCDDIGMDEYDKQPILVVTFASNDENAKKVMGMEKPTIQDRIFLDMENGVLAFGTNKNVKLGRLREALGQNDPKKTWNFNMLRGAGPVKVMVDHNPDKEDPTKVYARITRYAKAK